MRGYVGLLLAAAAVGVAVAQGAARWVQRTKVDVRRGRGSYHDVVDTVTQGETVQVLRTEGQWLLVETPRQKQGWLVAATLADKPVGKSASDFLKLVPGDASTSATAASVGAKGIYAEQYAKNKGFDYGVVTWAEQSQPPAADIEAFVRAGGLRPAGGTS